LRIGFGKTDITPRVGVELCGFGPFVTRHSIAVRDRLWARAMAVEKDGRALVLVSCDLIGLVEPLTRAVRHLVGAATALPPEAIMVHCTHTHSGPNTGGYIGWGAPDEPYLETLPALIAQACVEAVQAMRPAALLHAEVPCEGIGQNREYDRDALPLEEVLADEWRPQKPELTDTTCHVIKVESGGRLIGFASYFGCHPVVCCRETRYIHGDFPGVATNLLEREHPGAVGLFLQGAQGDVNSCVVHKPEQDSLLALDVIAARYANAVRNGLREARLLVVDEIRCALREVVFHRKPWDLARLRAMLAEQEAVLHAPGARDGDRKVRMATVNAIALRQLVATAEAGESLEPPTELQGFRLGPLALLAAPFEIFQAIKNEVRAQARSPIALVMGVTNDSLGYAPDQTAAARGGYAADTVPLICGALPFADIHSELVCELLQLETALY